MCGPRAFWRSVRRPLGRHHLPVAALRLRAADGDHLEPIRAGREGAGRLRRDANDVPGPHPHDPPADDHAAAAGDHDVGLLLLTVAMRVVGDVSRRIAPVADAEVARLELAAAEPSLDPVDPARDGIVELEQVYVGETRHAVSFVVSCRT